MGQSSVQSEELLKGGTAYLDVLKLQGLRVGIPSTGDEESPELGE